VISGSSGSADGFQVVRQRSPGVIDMLPALIYASVQWRDGIIDAKTRLQPAQQKTKYLWRMKWQKKYENTYFFSEEIIRTHFLSSENNIAQKE
jgi:hypothetical protein